MIKYCICNFEWNECFLLCVLSVDVVRGEFKVIVFTVWDKDRFSLSDFFGVVVILFDCVLIIGSVVDLDMDLKVRIVLDFVGEVCFIYLRVFVDLGKFRVKVSAFISDVVEIIVKIVNLGRIDFIEGISLVMSVYVVVIVVRKLLYVDIKGFCDVFAYVRMDNAFKNEFCRIDIIVNMFYFVWNNGMGKICFFIVCLGFGDVLF